LSKDVAGSSLDGIPSEPESRAALEPLLSVRQAARLLGVCAATVYRMCEQRELGHFRVRNAIRVPVGALKDYLARARG
jgi:excisionase family DNA binding protein